jgi:hypothetical protein
MTRFHDRYVTRDEHVRELDKVQTEAAIDWRLALAGGVCAGVYLVFTIILLTNILMTQRINSR